jgi:hypothetical protein
MWVLPNVFRSGGVEDVFPTQQATHSTRRAFNFMRPFSRELFAQCFKTVGLLFVSASGQEMRLRHEFQSLEISLNVVDLRIGTYSAILGWKWDNAIKISVDQKACPPPIYRAHTYCDFQLSRCRNGQYPINQRGFTLRGSTEAVFKSRELASKIP